MKYQSIDVEYYRYMKARKECKEDLNLILKGMKYGYFLFVIIILLSAFFSGNLVFAQSSNIEFEFENGYAYNGALPESSVLENQRFTTGATGHFPATYSFENETLETFGMDLKFIDNKHGDAHVTVLPYLDGHSKIIKINYSSSWKYALNYLDDILFGTIEMWVRLEETNQAHYLYIRGNHDLVVYWASDGSVYYNDGSSHFIESYSADIWYHIRIEFDVLTDWHLWIDGISKDSGSGYGYAGGNPDDMNQIAFFSGSADPTWYIDAVGYSWDLTYNTSYTNEIVISEGSYNSGSLSDTYIDDSNYYVIDSETFEEQERVLFEIGFSMSIDGLFNCYITSDEIMDVFKLRDNLANTLYDSSGTDVMNIMDLDVNVPELHIFTDKAEVSYSVSVDYIELKYNVSYGYIVGSNLISEVGLLDETETDKFEFTFDNSGVINQNGADDVNGFSDIENDYFSNDVVNIIDSVDDSVDKAIRITSAQLGNCGIERDFDIGVNTSEVWWQLDLVQLGYPECEIYTKIENANSDVIAWFKLNGSYHPFVSKLADLSYYYDSEWVLLKSNIPVVDNYNMTFVLNWTDGYNSGVLGFDGDMFPITFENEQNSIGNFQIYAINDNNIVYNTLDFQIDWIRIIVNGSSISDELMPSNLFVLSGYDFSLLYQSFIEITFDITYENNVSIYLNDDVLLLDYGYNVTAERIFFGNFYQDKSYGGLFFSIYNNSEYKIENIKVYGIQMVNQQDSNDNPFLEFDYSNVNPNVSYFYVSGNDLYYHFETDDNSNLEYIQATFDISDLSCEGYSVAFTHQKGTTYLQSECKIQFTSDTYLAFLSVNASKSESVILPQEKIVQEIIFLITDDNEQIIDTSEGYFSNILFQYYSDIGITITTLSLIEVIPLLILLVIVPIAIYYGFDKRAELIVPSLVLMSIFCTAMGLIPIWLEVVILFSCLTYYILRERS